MNISRSGTPAFSMLRRTLAAVLAAGLLALTPPVVATGSGQPDAGSPRAAAAPHRIDTSDRAAVAEAWRSRWAGNVGVHSGWTGDVDGCDAGKPSAKAQRATLESINFARAMAGLDAVRFDPGLSRRAQEAALIMTANNALSHDPPTSWRCWSKTGREAAGRSNLAWTSAEMTAGESVELYLDDAGSSNRVAGHRRWVLNPFVTAMGNGLTRRADALYVLGPADDGAANPAWVTWPTPRWFPAGLEPRGRWSLSTGASGADFSQARVTVKRGTRKLPVTRYQPHNGYAQPTLVFQVKGLRDTGRYRVVVRDIRGAASAEHAWAVRLFKP